MLIIIYDVVTGNGKTASDMKGILHSNEINDFLSILLSFSFLLTAFVLKTSAEFSENNTEFLLLNNDRGQPYCLCSIYIFSHCPLTSWFLDATFDSL